MRAGAEFLTASSFLCMTLVGSACRPPASTLRYDDLVTDRGALVRPTGDSPAQHPCADQTHFSRSLDAGRTLSFSLELGRAARLVLDFCSPSRTGGELRVEVRGAGATAPVTGSFPLRRRPAWVHREMDLARLSGTTAGFSVTPVWPEGSSLLMRDLYVVHRTREPATWPHPGVSLGGERWQDEPASAPAGERSAGGRARGRPQILLVSIDTLRDDVVGPLDSSPEGRSHTPNLDRLAADGEVFSPHYAASSWTLPSHASLLTGYPVPVHRTGIDRRMSLPSHVPTLAERMHDAGLATGAAVHDCEWLNPSSGLHRGFEDYRSERWSTGQLSRAAVNWIASHRDEPFFFFLHTFDVHSDFAQLPYEGRGATVAKVRRRFGVRGYGCRAGECASGLLRSILDREIEPLPRERAILRYLYRAGVRETDAELGRLFSDLRELGLYERMLIVVTSDHGELLLEHGDTLHGRPWEEISRVPLIVKWPDGAKAGTTSSIPTSAVDIAPTLLSVIGATLEGLPGEDLREPVRDRPVVTMSGFWTLRHRSMKAIFSDHTPGGVSLLFDLANDPAESADLAARRPRDLDRFRNLWEEEARRYDEIRRRLEGGSRGDDGESQPLSEERRRRLRSLGYLE